MGVLNFIVDAGQSGQLSEHDDEIATLKENVAMLSRWVLYLNEQIEEMKNDRIQKQEGNGKIS